MYSAASLVNPDNSAPIVLVCEHASSFIPTSLNNLGLADEHRYSHAVWDIGAKRLAENLSALLNAPLVLSNYSRLVYDCNRPIESDTAVPSRSETITIPGNEGLSLDAIKERYELAYVPFHNLLRSTIDSQRSRCTNTQTAAEAEAPIVLITLHSFTPVYFGQERRVELGLIHDKDATFASLMNEASPDITGLATDLNEPYDANDGVTHTLKLHATPANLPHVMIEVRNDLLANEDNIATIADTLGQLISESMHSIGITQKPVGTKR